MPEAHVGFVPDWRRPVRIPADVPLGGTDPPFAIAGQKGTWRATLRLARAVPAGAILKLETASPRNNKPAFVGDQVERTDADGYLTLHGERGLHLAMSADEEPGRYVVQVPGSGLEAGHVLRLILGDRSGGGGGMQMPTARALDKFVLLYVARDAGDRPGTWSLSSAEQIVAVCSMHILGGPIHHLRAYAPSQVRPGQPFYVLVRPEDQFSNLSHELLSGADVLIGDESLETEQEPVAQSSCLRLRTALPQEGVHRLRIVGRPGRWEAITNPIVCPAEGPACRTFWGMMHGHTEISDGRESLDRYFHQLRYEAALDFAATADHDGLHETPDVLWQQVCRAVEEWHAPGTFVTFLGYEWARWRRNGDGDRNVYYLHDHRPMFRSDDRECPTPPDLFRALQNEQAIIVPHHPANPGNWCDWKDHDPEHERLVEIYQALGSYECAAADGNPLPQRHEKPLFERGYVRDALAMGWRVGFAGGGDDHSGHAGTEFPFDGGHDGRKAGLMAVLAAERTREAIWDALWNRRVIATTGPRILLDYSLNGHAMGSELTLAAEPRLAHSRRLRVCYHGTAPVERIEIIRNNRIAHSVRPRATLDCEVEWEDVEELDGLWMPPAKFWPKSFCFYYVRALQADGEMAWASPIWIEQ